MIRKFTKNDTAAVMQVWLETIVVAHDFVNEKYWRDAIENVRKNYILNSESYVYIKDGGIVGFVSIIEENTIGAIFVEKPFQDKGIGGQLLERIQSEYDKLYISVFEKNQGAKKFLLNRGFKFLYKQHDVNTDEVELLFIWEKREHEL
ncbi:MAG: N-acetyltransferase [Proteocatella sp.]